MAHSTPEPVTFDELQPENTYFQFNREGDGRGFFVKLKAKQELPQVKTQIIGSSGPIKWEDFQRSDDLKFYEMSDYKTFKTNYPDMKLFSPLPEPLKGGSRRRARKTRRRRQ